VPCSFFAESPQGSSLEETKRIHGYISHKRRTEKKAEQAEFLAPKPKKPSPEMGWAFQILDKFVIMDKK